MPKFRTRPIEVEAFKWTGPGATVAGETVEPVPAWFQEARDKRPVGAPGSIAVIGEDLLVYGTSDLTQVGVGEWVVREASGQIYKVSDEAFAAEYELMVE